MKKMIVIAVSIVLLTGCLSHSSPRSLVTPPSAQAEAPPMSGTLTGSLPRDDMESANLTRVQQCRQELDVIRAYNQADYEKYLAEYQLIGMKNTQFMQVKDSIGPDIVRLVAPRYEYMSRELCFRIRNQLSRLLIQAASS
ncbi:lipoprotein [Pantoea sp. 1.19]|uniref:lipoprotein n=1 Tax=Pantoea sp. 1.19 TaxID=1925589 RepID=UPI001F0ABE07|nr:hypothetical protein [Pantoea sp. 1.19]